MKEDLQQHVAQLLREFGAVLPVKNLQHFVGFFEKIGFQRLMRLLAVPWTSVRRAQRGKRSFDGVVLAFRGTLPLLTPSLPALLDWINNFEAQPVAAPPLPGAVHTG